MTDLGKTSDQLDEFTTLLRKGVKDHILQSTEQALRKVFRERRELWIDSVAHMLSARDLGKVGETPESVSSGAGSWMAIASLSQLRKEVGGRFQNLRTRWLEAGFPLKAHRGDPSEDYNLDQSGWLEMTSWLLKQGYESRLLEDLSVGYFEIRKPE